MGASGDELKRDAGEQRARMSDTLEAIGDRLSPERMVERRKAAVGQKWQQVKHSVMGSPDYDEPATRRLRESAGSVVGSAGGVVQGAAERVQDAPQAIADQARGNPIAAGLVAFGVGALFATVIPKTRTEHRLVEQARPQLEQAADEMKTVGRDVGADAKEHARTAAQKVKSAGAEATATVRDQAQQSAEQVRSEPTS